MNKLKIGPIFFIILFALIATLVILTTQTTSAQGAYIEDWQNTATGMAVGQYNNKTAGLGMIVDTTSWPSISLRGGVKDAGWGKITNLFEIELGNIQIPAATTADLTNESVDWAHNELTFSTNTNSQLKVWVSRLTAALLVQNSSNSINLFTGNVVRNTINDSNFSSSVGPTSPKYAAYQRDGIVHVHNLNEAPLSLSALDANWILLWYGNNSHFVDTKVPLIFNGDDWATGTIPSSHAYQADAPILLVFQNQPTLLEQASEGGITISFSSQTGHFTMLPLFGRDHLRASTTENWGQQLPNDVLLQTKQWASYNCNYPETVQETYAYDTSSDTTTITENISFLNICNGGTQFAPIPPSLGIAKNSLGVIFSAPVVDGFLNTEFGPSHGIENTNTYSWQVAGLNKFVAVNDPSNHGTVPVELEQELESEVQKLIAAGHIAPWIFVDNVPKASTRGDLYWANPADIIYHLTKVAEVLSEENKQTLINYIQAERNAYPPEEVFDLNLTEGSSRKYFTDLRSDTISHWTNNRDTVHQTDVPLYNFYSLAQFYNLTDEDLPNHTWQAAINSLDQDLREQDWATSYWFKGFADRRIPVVNANRHFSGLVGFIRLAQHAKESNWESLGRAFLAKAAVSRISMAQYPRYLYRANLIELPEQPNWQVVYSAGKWHGLLFNYEWTGPYDDARQVSMLDQFGVFLYDHSGFMEPGTGYDNWGEGATAPYLTSFRDMSPEVADFIVDFVKDDVEIYIEKVEALFPHWYAAYAEGSLGVEHNLSHPINSYQIFMAKALIQDEPPSQLVKYIDIPWIQEGDLFYMHKLAETIRAYRDE